MNNETQHTYTTPTPTTPHPMSRRMATSSWLVALLAVAELILGFVLLSFPYLLGASAVWVIGVVLLAAGLMRLVQVFTRPGYRLWNLLGAIIYFVLGVAFILRPGVSMAAITLAIGLALLVGGVLRLGVAFSLRHEQGSAWRFFNAIVSIVLGAIVTWSWPQSSFWLIGTIIAVEMIFSGWTLLFLALAPRNTHAYGGSTKYE